MTYETYKVTCKKCKGYDTLKITPDRQVFYTEHTPIIAARFRGDLQWGFECQCGNDNRLAAIEKTQAEMLVKNASPTAFQHILDSLKLDDKKQFAMEKL